MSDRVRLLARSLLRFLARLLLRAAERLGEPRLVAIEQKASMREAMAAHDMVSDPDEGYYLAQYLAAIDALDLAGATVLDAGTGSGRLLASLSRRAGTVVGVDYLEEAVAAARRHSGALPNVELVQSDLLDFLRGQPGGAYDVVVFLEVAFVLPHLDDVLDEIARVLRPGGALVASFRTRLFVAQHAVAARDWELARAALEGEAATLPGVGYQRWHDAATATAALESRGFRDVSLSAIGGLSGIEGDPLSALARPSELDDDERAWLARLEDAFARSRPDGGRYLLASATLAAVQG